MLSESEYNRLRRQLIAEFKHKLAALNTLANKPAGTGINTVVAQKASSSKAASRDYNQPPTATNSQDSAQPAQEGTEPTLAGAVRRAIDVVDRDFTMPDVFEALKTEYPDMANRNSVKSTISHYLKRLSVRGEIAIVTKGVGKAPSVFRKFYR